jgi:hypothetical protein
MAVNQKHVKSLPGRQHYFNRSAAEFFTGS